MGLNNISAYTIYESNFLKILNSGQDELLAIPTFRWRNFAAHKWWHHGGRIMGGSKRRWGQPPVVRGLPSPLLPVNFLLSVVGHLG